MAKSSINFKKSCSGFEHNDRSEKHEAKYLLPVQLREENSFNRSSEQGRDLLNKYLEEAKENYRARTKQKLQAKVLTVEAVVNLNKWHTMDHLEKLTEHIKNKYGLREVQASIHRDEGHINQDGSVVKNYHAHIIFCNLDKDGKTILRNLSKDDLRQLQSDTADLLNMTRGQSATITKAKHKTPQQFKLEKTQENLVDYRDLAKKLQEENKLLRAQLKEAGASREDYAKLEQLNKDLKAQLQDKTLTELELNTKLEEARKEAKKVKHLEHDVVMLKNQNECLQNTTGFKKALESETRHLQERADLFEGKFDKIYQEKEELKEKLTKLEQFKRYIKHFATELYNKAEQFIKQNSFEQDLAIKLGAETGLKEQKAPQEVQNLSKDQESQKMSLEESVKSYKEKKNNAQIKPRGFNR